MFGQNGKPFKLVPVIKLGTSPVLTRGQQRNLIEITQLYGKRVSRGGETVMFFFSSRRRHTRFVCDWSSDVCSSDLFHFLSTFLTLTITFGGDEKEEFSATTTTTTDNNNTDDSLLSR